MSLKQPVTKLDASQIQLTDQQVRQEKYLARLPRALDIFIAELCGGPMDDTISSDMAHWATEKPVGSLEHHIGSLICKGLNSIESDHGAKAEEADKERASDEVTRENTAQQALNSQG